MACPRSYTATRNPAAASSSAAERPMMPPPAIATSTRALATSNKVTGIFRALPQGLDLATLWQTSQKQEGKTQ